MIKNLFFPFLLIALHISCASHKSGPISLSKTGTSALLQAISITSEGDIWVSGHEGTVLLSENRGQSWKQISVPGTDSLQFRDVHAFSSGRVILLSAGEGAKSQIWLSANKGESWERSFLMDHPKGFINCTDFFDESTGLVLGDTIEDELFMMMTTDSGKTWNRLQNLPSPVGSEGGFSASGTCVRIDEQVAHIVTGAGDFPRMIRINKSGRVVSADSLPLARGEAAGATTITFPDAGPVISGGDLAQRDSYDERIVIHYEDSWEELSMDMFAGAIYGSASIGSWISVVGPNGWAVKNLETDSWIKIDSASWWATESFEDSFMATGPQGRIAFYPIGN